MAEGEAKESNISVSQDRFACAICLGLLKDPVTIPCGHNYCMSCITACWDSQESAEDGAGCRCPQCRMTFTPRPALCRNPLLAEMAEKLRDTAGGEETPAVAAGAAVTVVAVPGEVECTACIVGRKRKADKSCLDCLASYCESHFNRHEELHPGKRHKVVEAVAQLEEKLCSKHNKPLEVWCRTDQVCICPLCIVDDHKAHDVITAAAAKVEKQRELSKSSKEQITQLEKELEQLRGAVGPFKNSVKASLDASDKTLKELITFLETKFSELKESIKAREQAILGEADQLEGTLQNNLQYVKLKDDELGQLSHTDDPIHFLKNLPILSPPQDLHISVGSHIYFGAVQTILSKLNQHVTECLQKDFNDIASHVKGVFIENTNRMDLMQYFCKLELDKDSAFRHHRISLEASYLGDLGTAISWRHEPITYDVGDNRFEWARQVLCINALKGRHYWEVWWNVERTSKTIKIAIAYSSISRTKSGVESEFGRNDKSWSLSCSDSGFEFQHDDETIEINSPVTNTVGVFVDKPAGILAFYGIYGKKATLLYRARPRFHAIPYPGFYVDSFTEVKIRSRDIILC